jgi:hypothetical protein
VVTKHFWRGRYLGDPCCLSSKLFLVSTGWHRICCVRYLLIWHRNVFILGIWNYDVYDGIVLP